MTNRNHFPGIQFPVWRFWYACPIGLFVQSNKRIKPKVSFNGKYCLGENIAQGKIYLNTKKILNPKIFLSKVGEDTYEKCPEKYTQHCWLVECRGAVSSIFIFCICCCEIWNRHLCLQELRDVPRWERRCSTCASSWALPSTCTWPRWSTIRKVVLKCCTLPRGCSNTSPSSSTTSTSPRSTTARTCSTWPPWLRWSSATTGLKSVAILKHGQDPSIVKWLLDIGADFHRRCYGTYDCDHQLVVIHRLLPFILSKPYNHNPLLP